jgi:serine/threonine protein phosphatase PrpC
MADHDSGSSRPKGGGLWARLFGVSQEEPSEQKDEAEASPVDWDESSAPPAELIKPAVPVAPAVPGVPPLPAVPLAVPLAAPVPPVVEEVEAEPCPACRTPRKGAQPFCDDCGWMFGATAVKSTPKPRTAAAPSNTRELMADSSATPVLRIKDRYELRDLVSERAGICRYRGVDHGSGGMPVTIVWAPLPDMVEPIPLDEDARAAPLEDEEILPTFDDPVPVATVAPAGASFPSIAWERGVVEKAQHAAVPKLLDSFVDNNFEYLVLEAPAGRVLWDAWDDPDATAAIRYGWLKDIAEGLQALHQAGAVIEGLRPDLVTITNDGQAMLADLTDLLPLPLPPNPPIRATLYTAPELILDAEKADARADLYSFGAMLYALEYLHHGLEEKDFESQYTPRQITDRFPDVHPLFLRLINKTFVRDPAGRFPTDEAAKTDATGFSELIRTLEVCQRAFDNVRLDIAAWTTTGMVRTGNEDAFTVLHGVDARQDDLHEYAMVLLADGMGGYEAGEIAADMALNQLRRYLLEQPMFAALSGNAPPKEAFDVEACKQVLHQALRHTNREVYTYGRTPGKGKRGMGCTAEAVYIDSRNVVVGHVGDSRTYHLHQGRLIQLTRDQTLVTRLVEIGKLTAEEAENHPRKNELQQAIGGQPDVVPGLYHGKLKRGDWVLVCSDGLTNHIPADDLEKMLTREAAFSAEEAARRLLNLVNLRGATDNATIVVVRAC